MGYGRSLRIGLMVPSSNTTMEPELHRMAPRGVSVHTARMRLEEVTPEGLVQMAEDAGRAARLLATAGVDVLVYGCTTGSLVGGVEWEENLMQRIGDDAGTPAISTGSAVVEAIKVLGGSKVAVATPYTDDLNALERAFLEAHGIRVKAMKGLGLVSNLEIGETEGETIRGLVRSVADGADTVFISCTNLPTIELIEGLEAEMELPIVTSNQASLWAALHRFGFKGLKGYGKLLRERF